MQVPSSNSNSKSKILGGPPPSYRSSTYADDSSTFSSESSVVYANKRRNSWANLIENDGGTLYGMKKDSLMSSPRVPSINDPSEDRILVDKYNLNGRYAKHFMPFYSYNAAGDPIAISKIDLMHYNGQVCKLNAAEAPAPRRLKTDRMEKLRHWHKKPRNKFCTFLLFLLTIAIGIIILLLLTQRSVTEQRTFSWLPPLAMRMGQKSPTTVKLYKNNGQARFDISGNLPLKNDYNAVYDFRTRKVAIIDSSLRDEGKNLVCFVMNMNMTTMPDIYAMEIGAQNAVKKKEQTQGWEESWYYIPGPYFGNTSTLFNPEIPECRNARWIQLNYTLYNQKGHKCSDCYDFCLPELGLERDRIRAETFLNIIRRDCFYLFVPEWRSFAAAYSNEQNQRDFEKFYTGNGYGNGFANNNEMSNGNGFGNGHSNNNLLQSGINSVQNAIGGVVQPLVDQYRNFESKWIALQQIPQQVSNLTNRVINQAGNIASNVQDTFSNVAQGIVGNNQQQQQRNGQSQYSMNMPPSSYSYNPNNNGNNLYRPNGEFSVSMPPPSYPDPPKTNQQLSNPGINYQNPGSSYTGQSTGNNGMFSQGNSPEMNGQYMQDGYLNMINSYNRQPHPLDRLPNTMQVDQRYNKPISVYDQPSGNVQPNNEYNAQSNTYTTKPEIDGIIQTQGQNLQVANGQRNMNGANDQGWITVG